MIKRLLILAFILLPFQVVSFGQENLKDKIDEQVKRVKFISGSSSTNFGDLPYTFWGTDSLPEDNPIRALVDSGMDSVPFLIPYLTDTSLTNAYRRNGKGDKWQIAVNEYIIFIIQKITAHTFAATYQNGKPDQKDLQNQILKWWQNNHSKTLLERKLDEVNDSVHTNRFSAYEWIGKTKTIEGRILLEKRIETLLTGGVDSLKQGEMAACAKSLGLLGNTESVKSVRKVCEHLSYWMYMCYEAKSGRSATHSSQLTDLFKAFQALSALGLKQEALSELNLMKSKYFDEMEFYTQKEFQRNLEYAEQW